MVLDEARRIIDALAREEIISEIAKANRSRFTGDNFAYLHQRLVAVDRAAHAQ
jgi:hypothetical protein